MNSSTSSSQYNTNALKGTYHITKRSYSQMSSNQSLESQQAQKEEESQFIAKHLNSEIYSNYSISIATCPNHNYPNLTQNPHNDRLTTYQPNTYMLKQSSLYLSSLNAFESNFTSNKIPRLMSLINHYCTKAIKRTNKNDKSIKVMDLFKKATFSIDKAYSEKTAPINIYLVVYDMLISKNIYYESILCDKAKIGNLLLYYLSQVMVVDIGKKLLSVLNSTIDKYNNSTLVLSFENVTNIKNENENSLLRAIGSDLDSFEEYYRRTGKDEGEKIIKTMGGIEAIDAVKQYDYDKDAWVRSLLNDNSNYMINRLLKNEEILAKYSKHEHLVKCELKERAIKVYKMQLISNQIHSQLYNELFNMNIFYVNTIELIQDYLSFDEDDDNE